jgi:hypothetical protein
MTEICCVCQTSVDEDHIKVCEKCEKVCGTHRDFHCVGLCWCQSVYVICRNCYDYTCECCGGELNNTITYIGDADPQPICPDCLGNMSD